MSDKLQEKAKNVLDKFFLDKTSKSSLSELINADVSSLEHADAVSFRRVILGGLHSVYCPKKSNYKEDEARFSLIIQDLIITLNEKIRLDSVGFDIPTTSSQDENALSYIQKISAALLDADAEAFHVNPPGGHGAGFVQRSQPVRELGLGYVAPKGFGEDK